MSDNIEDCGYIYLIKPQLFSLSNININKAGMSQQYIYLRLNKYGFGSELYTYFYVKNVRKNEKDIIKLLTNDGKNNKNIQKIYGDEYFLMDYKYMLEIIKNVIQNDIIFEMDINKDIQNYKHNKIFVYYDKEMNNEIYDKVKLEVGDYENNYLNRLKYFYNIYAKDVYPDTTDLINNIDFINFSNNIPRKNNEIVSNKIVSNEIVSNEIISNEIISNEVISNEVVSNEIVSNEIVSNEIVSNEIVSNEVVSNEIVSNEIVSNEVVSNEVVSNEVVSNEVVFNEVVTDEIINNEVIEYVSNQNIQGIYICHYCLYYVTKNKSDMVKHYKKKKRCEQNNLKKTYNECEILSTSKKYIFNIDYKQLNINDILYIVTKYNEKVNYIKNDYKKNKNVIKNKIEIKNTNKINKNKNHILDNFFVNDKYECIHCLSKFITRQGLERHLESNICKKKQKLNKLLNFE